MVKLKGRTDRKTRGWWKREINTQERVRNKNREENREKEKKKKKTEREIDAKRKREGCN